MRMQGGFIWLFYGTKNFPVDERPPIPMVPELEDPTWKPVYGEIEFECNHWSVFENAIDMAHIHYLHDDTFGNQVGHSAASPCHLLLLPPAGCCCLRTGSTCY